MIAEKDPVKELAAARLIEVSEDVSFRSTFKKYLLAEMEENARLDKARDEGWEAGREEVITLIEQGYSLDDAKTILSKKLASEDDTRIIAQKGGHRNPIG